ncbi:MAG: hypothetical protein MJZ37_00220 [Bacilli bacterium]|nr:hypothetical protein [Bacilli bacterium]
MKFNIDKETAEELISVINYWAINHSLVECCGSKAIGFKCDYLEPALEEGFEEDSDE